MDLDDMNTADQAAEYLKLTPEKLKRLARAREIAYVKAGRSYLFSRGAILDWVRRNSREAKPDLPNPWGLTERALQRQRDGNSRVNRGFRR
jgi:excisionase family DNA binding protein